MFLFTGSSEKRPNKVVGLRLSDKNVNEWEPLTNDPPQADKKEAKKKPTTLLKGRYAFLIVAYCLALFCLVVRMDARLPPIRTAEEAVQEDGEVLFSEVRAREYLRQLISVGPRPAGSYANEVLAVDFLKREVKAIQSKANPKHRISVDLQKPRGSFNLEFVDGLTHHYRDIQNFVVKLEPGVGQNDTFLDKKRHSLLLNCHFDSVPQSPGASDDAVSCAIMLEILSALARSPNDLRHAVVFLFNGAEENMLPGSHGFITQHEWADEVRAFVNLEACGAGGREIVFQSGPR